MCQDGYVDDIAVIFNDSLGAETLQDACMSLVLGELLLRLSNNNNNKVSALASDALGTYREILSKLDKIFDDVGEAVTVDALARDISSAASAIVKIGKGRSFTSRN
jgi:hypothetical protein